jgi:hypothetical protein
VESLQRGHLLIIFASEFATKLIPFGREVLCKDRKELNNMVLTLRALRLLSVLWVKSFFGH